MSSNTIRIGTRSSALAMWQAHWVAAQLNKAGWKTELITMETKGDKVLSQSLAEIGSKGLFTEELEEKLLKNEIDIAVHSAKDMPSELPLGLELIAFSEREEPRDVLVSYQSNILLEQTKPLTIGTSSVRRKAFLRRYFPQHSLVDIRGNLQTRFKKMQDGACDAMVLAYAGVHRMELSGYIRQHLDTKIVVPPVGQGSLAIEASINLEISKKESILQVLNHAPSAACVQAERSFLKTMQGGCSVPAFAHAYFDQEKLFIDGGIISVNGKDLIQLRKSLASPIELGKTLAEEVLQLGGHRILSKIKQHKK
jgi:hydroxymethylbilane synthase